MGVERRKEARSSADRVGLTSQIRYHTSPHHQPVTESRVIKRRAEGGEGQRLILRRTRSPDSLTFLAEDIRLHLKGAQNHVMVFLGGGELRSTSPRHFLSQRSNFYGKK
jgi:hypothetical protein